MSIHKSTTRKLLNCDICRKPLSGISALSFQSTDEARDAARIFGWTFTDSKDICPDCPTPERPEGTR